MDGPWGRGLSGAYQVRRKRLATGGDKPLPYG